jgi:hypothetical protein
MVFSNATSMQRYTGWFTGVDGSVPIEVGSVSADYQTGMDSNNHHVNVGGIGWGVGVNVPGVSNVLNEVGAPRWEIHGSATYTWVNGSFSP